MNKDGHTNNNGEKIIEMYKMSGLKIPNGRVGRDRTIGNYTCYTTNSNCTMNYALLSMELFPYVYNVYVDILDNCMSDVHCHIGLVISCKPIVYIQHENVMHI